MSELVLLHHNEPMTTSLAIAEGVELEHKTVIQLVRKYLEDLQKFGPCAFEMRMVDRKQGGGRQAEVFFLNEGQSIFLLTLMRNSEIVVRFKLALVQAFLALRDNLQKIQGNAAAPQFLTSQAGHGADLAVAADRTFRSFMRAARSAGMALPQALRIANAKTVERTGMDMLAELDIDPGEYQPAAALAAPPPDPFADAVAAWAAEVPPGSEWRMVEILARAAGVQAHESRKFNSLAPVAGRLLGRLGWKRRRRWVDGRHPWMFIKP